MTRIALPSFKGARLFLIISLFIFIGLVFASQMPGVKSSVIDLNVNLVASERADLLKNSLSSSPTPTPTPDPNFAPHDLVGSFYTLRNGLKSTLLLNNKGIQPIDVYPTLYGANGLEFQVPLVTVEASNGILIDIQDWVNLAGEPFRSGNVKLFHRGKDLVLGAQIYIEDAANGLSFEEKLSEVGKFDSRQLEGIWFQPQPSTNVKIALSNTTAEALSISAKLTRNPNFTGVTEMISFNPHETKLLDLQEDFADGSEFANSQAIALSLEHAGDKNALLARAMVFDREKGYSNTVQFYNPLTGKTRQYHGAGLRLKVGNQNLRPIVVVRNSAGTQANLTGRVPYTRADGTTGLVNLPNVSLLPNEIRLLDMGAVINRNQQENINIAGIEFEYDTAEGSVQISAHSVSQDRDHVFRVPMYDPLAQKSPTGGYPFRIEENSFTRAFLKNISNQEQDYVAFLILDNGSRYMIGVKTLKPRQTIEIDFKKLRDQQIPDERGNTIPLSVAGGQFQWTLRMRYAPPENGDPLEELAIVGRSEQINTANKTSSNYACQNCCMGSYAGGFIIPSNQSILPEIGKTIQYRAFILETTCYSDPYEYEIYHPFATWTSSNTSAATIAGSGVATVTGPGTTSIKASFFAPVYISYPCPPPIPFAEIGKDWLSCVESDGFRQRGPNASQSEVFSSTLLLPGCGQCFSAGFQGSLSTALNIAPTLNITAIKAVGKNQTALIRVTTNNPGNVPITLTLEPNPQTTGAAQFTSTNSGTRQITQTTNVEVKGVTESSTKRSMRLEAKYTNANNQVVSLGTMDFTVIKATLSLRYGNSDTVSTDNIARSNYMTAVGTTNLGGPRLTPAPIWIHGIEIAATILPSDVDELFTLERVFNGREHNNQTLTKNYAGCPDTSTILFLDNDPRSNGSQGKVYDLDAPGFNIPNSAPSGTIFRARTNFTQWLSVFQWNGENAQAVRVSDNIYWFQRLSLSRNTGTGTSVINDVSTDTVLDNILGAGETNLTWNLATVISFPPPNPCPQN